VVEATDPFIHLMKAGVKPGLTRICKLLKALGEPQQQFRSILVGGSNGKGTTCAVLESILRASGYRTGLFTSPHLISVRERFRIDGKAASLSALKQFIREYDDLLRKTGATYFEATTACAIWLFAQRKVDWAVLEIGLGGRWDACNAVDPELAVITSISKEHTEYLGNTLGEIATEKAQIARRQRPVIVGEVGTEARRRLASEFRRLRAVPVWFNRDFRVSEANLSATGGRFQLSSPDHSYRLRTRLLGTSAVGSTALAAVAAEQLGVPMAAIRSGVASAQFAGRLQVVGRNPLVVADVAHNRAAMYRLVRDWQIIWPGRRPVVVVGLLGDKPVMAVGRALAEMAEVIISTRPESHRARDPQDLARSWRSLDCPIAVIPDIAAAVRSAGELAGKRGSVLVCGSHFVVGPALRALGWSL